MTQALVHRAVVYRRRRDGSFDIRFTEPWTGKRRLEAFPANIRQMVQDRHAIEATADQVAKLKSASQISPEMYQAVWDDIMCEKAVRLVEMQDRPGMAPGCVLDLYRDRRHQIEELEPSL